MVFMNHATINPKPPKPQVQLLIDILKVADKFDRLTAMNINHPPMSELAAMSYFHENITQYDHSVITALADSIQILPAGACLDFANGEKGLVLADNPADFLHPMILNFKDNQIYDLSDPEVSDQLQIVDIMKTMDNRIAIDSDTLKQFVADPYIKATADRFRAQKEKISQRRNPSLSSLHTAQPVIDKPAATVSGPSIASRNEAAPAPKKRPAKRKKLI